MEGPAAHRSQLLSRQVRRELRRWGLSVVGHTAYYLPLDSCIEKIQTATISEVIDDFKFFKQVGASKVTIHLAFTNPRQLYSWEEELNLWQHAFEPLVQTAESLGLQILLEHYICGTDTILLFEELFSQFPNLRFHLDVGHANLGKLKNVTPLLLEKFGKS